MTLEEIRAALGDRNLERVSEATGVHRTTLSAIRSGRNRNPAWRTLRTLAEYLAPACDVRHVQDRKVCVRCGVAWQADDPDAQGCKERTT